MVRACQVCRPLGRSEQSNNFTFRLVLSLQEGVQFDLLFYHFALQPGLGGEIGIPIVHWIDCCIRWSARMMRPPRSARDLLDGISIAWENVFGGMTVLISDGDTGVRSKHADGWAMYSQRCSALEPKSLKSHCVLVSSQYSV